MSAFISLSHSFTSASKPPPLSPPGSGGVGSFEASTTMVMMPPDLRWLICSVTSAWTAHTVLRLLKVVKATS